MVFEFSDLFAILIMDFSKLVSEGLVFCDEVVPVVFKFVCYVVEVLYLPFCLC